jgi:hypothetical protein
MLLFEADTLIIAQNFPIIDCELFVFLRAVSSVVSYDNQQIDGEDNDMDRASIT